MKTHVTRSRGIKSVRTMYTIVDQIKKNEETTVTELASELGVAKSTICNHIATLEELDFVVRDGRTVRLGLRFLDLGIHAQQTRGLLPIVEDELQKVAVETQETVWLIVEEHGEAVYLSRILGDNAVTTAAHVGSRRPLHSTAGGKAILAHLPPDRVNAIIEQHGLVEKTDQTIVNPDCLKDELATIRDRGIAFNDEENISGLRAVASPIVVEGVVLGAVSVTAPASRMRGERFREEIPNVVSGAVNAMELSLKYQNRKVW